MATDGFETDLASTINRHSAENGSNTPDYILAEFLARSIAAFDLAVNLREQWYGRKTAKPEPGSRAWCTCGSTKREVNGVWKCDHCDAQLPNATSSHEMQNVKCPACGTTTAMAADGSVPAHLCVRTQKICHGVATPTVFSGFTPYTGDGGKLEQAEEALSAHDKRLAEVEKRIAEFDSRLDDSHAHFNRRFAALTLSDKPAPSYSVGNAGTVDWVHDLVTYRRVEAVWDLLNPMKSSDELAREIVDNVRAMSGMYNKPDMILHLRELSEKYRAALEREGNR